MSAADDVRFWAKVSQGSGCWLWLGAPSSSGYGRTKVDGREVLAHRRAYQLLVGPIPAGLQIDHLCRNRICVRPSHMEVVTNRTNVLRGVGPSAANTAKERCPAGHQYDAANTYIDKRGKRYCRACGRDKQRIRQGWTGRLPTAERTHCPHGHPYDAANTRVYKGRRFCRACALESGRERRRRG